MLGYHGTTFASNSGMGHTGANVVAQHQNLVVLQTENVNWDRTQRG
jgi:hypothetical protein